MQARTCPRTGRPVDEPRRGGDWRWLFPLLGLGSLLWFLIRVIPKPSRAAYPCQRVAAPVASGFVLWLMGLVGSALAFRKAKVYWARSRYLAGAILIGVSVAVAWIAIPGWQEEVARAENPPTPNTPIGIAQGIHPGRVVWVHNPEATDWPGYTCPEPWWQSNHTNLAEVEKMVSQALRGLAGETTDQAAWDAIFRYFNQKQGKGSVGYQPGEKIAIKINLTTCNARSSLNYDKNPAYTNNIDNSPQMILALLRQLVNVVGVAQADISIGDPTCLVPNYLWNILHPEFPDVRYLDNYGGSGRTRAEFSTVPLDWSTPNAKNKVQDYLPGSFAQADYLINFAILKGHSAGVTLCGKNHYGSLIRTPDGYLRDAGVLNYYNMHFSLPNASWSPGTGKYRALVDLMGHPQLGGKTVLYLIDGLFGGYYWDAHPYKWNMAPFNGDWPSSLLASQDAVAVDSVAYDFLLAEWPNVVTGGAEAPGSLQGGADDYLHEAALADAPPSGAFYDPDGDGFAMASLGVHEHWNNPVDKQYSRNLGTGDGIELVSYVMKPNQAPLVNAGADRKVVPLSDRVVLEGTAEDDGLPSPPASLTVRWQKVSGPGDVTFANSSDAVTAVNFSQHGSYVLEFRASDGQYLKRDYVTITVVPFGDANMDEKVDVGDLGILAGSYGKASGALWTMGDFNGDGAVDVSDLGVLAGNYGTGVTGTVDLQADARAMGLSIGGEEPESSKVMADEQNEESFLSSACSGGGLFLVAGFVPAMITLSKFSDTGPVLYGGYERK